MPPTISDTLKFTTRVALPPSCHVDGRGFHIGASSSLLDFKSSVSKLKLLQANAYGGGMDYLRANGKCRGFFLKGSKVPFVIRYFDKIFGVVCNIPSVYMHV